MTVKVAFRERYDMDDFYTNLVQESVKYIKSASANIKALTVTIVTEPGNVESEKIILNNIKQYLRDKEINYDIEVS